jgi:hypothetical protein
LRPLAAHRLKNSPSAVHLASTPVSVVWSGFVFNGAQESPSEHWSHLSSGYPLPTGGFACAPGCHVVDLSPRVKSSFSSVFWFLVPVAVFARCLRRRFSVAQISSPPPSVGFSTPFLVCSGPTRFHRLPGRVLVAIPHPIGTHPLWFGLRLCEYCC